MEDLFEYGERTAAAKPVGARESDGGAAGRFRVVHTADWHLGKTLGDLPREREHARFLRFLRRTLVEEKADLLVVAGDVFDSANPPQSALRLYFEFLADLRRTADCRVLVIAGNHDSPTGLDAPRELLGALDIDVVGAAPTKADDAVFLYPDERDPAVAVAAVPFLRDRDLRTGRAGETRAEIEQALVEGIATAYRDAAAAVDRAVAAEVPAIATGHLTVKGSSPSESEREIHIGGLGSVSSNLFPRRFAYVALGHLHRPQGADDGRVRYAGSPIPLSFSEAADVKSLRVIDIVGGKIVGQRDVPIPIARPLVRLEAPGDRVAATVAAFAPPDSELPAWVELVVDRPQPGEDLVATARVAAEDRGFEVVRVLAGGAGAPSLSSPDPVDTAAYDDLLAHPEKVFARRLDAEPALGDREREALEVAFATLLEKQREGAT